MPRRTRWARSGYGKSWPRAESAPRDLHVVSFENDLDSLRLATLHPKKFPQVRHSAPFALLERGAWASAEGRLRWELAGGDFAAAIATSPAPDLIFYDLFSPKSAEGYWSEALFARVRARCGELSTELYTYSASTAVRAALLSAGFCVGRGIAMGPKEETTVAFATRARARDLLGSEWLARWERSQAQYPEKMSESDRARFAAAIRGHAQFTAD